MLEVPSSEPATCVQLLFRPSSWGSGSWRQRNLVLNWTSMPSTPWLQQWPVLATLQQPSGGCNEHGKLERRPVGKDMKCEQKSDWPALALLFGAVPSKAMEGSPSLRTTFKATFMLGLLRQEPDLITYTSLISAAAKKRDLKVSCCSRCRRTRTAVTSVVSFDVAFCNKFGVASGSCL